MTHQPKPTRGKCGTCGAAVVWASVTKRDGSMVRMPLNYTRARAYRFIGQTTGADGKVTDEFADREELVHVSHWLSCERPPTKSEVGT